MTKYVVGFMFNEKETHVLLITKDKPEWQRDKMNGLGGKIESGEKSIDAMRREFKEECGIDHSDWKYKLTMAGRDWSCDVYAAKSDKVFDFKQMEEEALNLIPLDQLDYYDLIPNLYWLIPLCLDRGFDYMVYNHP